MCEFVILKKHILRQTDWIIFWSIFHNLAKMVKKIKAIIFIKHCVYSQKKAEQCRSKCQLSGTGYTTMRQDDISTHHRSILINTAQTKNTIQ